MFSTTLHFTFKYNFIMKMTSFHSKFLMKKMKMKVFCCSSNVALATFSQRLLAEKPQMVDLDKRDRHSIYN